jgi:regulator of sigma E protease
VNVIANHLIGMVSDVLPLVVTLGVLIFVHEFGHFLLAKRAGVKVLKFSLGFGPRIFGWTRGETEYVVSWIPLGGYVKMLGENPGEEIAPEDQGRTLTVQPLLRKLAIVFAGPGMNLVLPIFLCLLLYLTGFPDLTARVGTVAPGSVAAGVGIRPGDRIVSIDGKPVRWWDDVDDVVRESAGHRVTLEIQGSGGRRKVTVVPVLRKMKTVLGDTVKLGDIGVSPSFEPALAAVSRLDSPAGKAGIKTGDEIIAIGSTRAAKDAQVVRRDELVAALRRSAPTLSLTVRREGKEVPVTLRSPLTPAQARRLSDDALLERLGLENPELFIGSVESHSPAAEAGMKVGDRLEAIDGKQATDWAAFTKAVRGSEGRPITLVVRRDGRPTVLVIKPGRSFNTDPLAKQGRIYYVGVGSLERLAPGTVASRVVANPIRATGLACQETWRMSSLVVRGMVKLATGQVRMDNIGGPIQIGVVAAQAAENGWTTFVRMMAFISINLGILNLLPIPILDGGHLLFFLIEGVKRGPISVRKKEFAQQVGLTMLLLLIGVAFYNDIARSWDQIVGFLRDVGLRLM